MASAINVASKRMIANIASDDALILPQHANPVGLNFWERHRLYCDAPAESGDGHLGSDRRRCATSRSAAGGYGIINAKPEPQINLNRNRR
jgi:hypothetical protein